MARATFASAPRSIGRIEAPLPRRSAVDGTHRAPVTAEQGGLLQLGTRHTRTAARNHSDVLSTCCPGLDYISVKLTWDPIVNPRAIPFCSVPSLRGPSAPSQQDVIHAAVEDEFDRKLNFSTPLKDPHTATTKPPGFGGVIRVQALTWCRWYTRSCRKQRPSESAVNAEPFEHWPGHDHWSRSTLSKLRAIISAAAASSAETTACSCDQRRRVM